MCWDAHRQLTSDARAPGVARHFSTDVIAARLGQRGRISALLDDVALVTSELVTNAVSVGAHEMHVTITVHRDRVRVEVYDDAAGMPLAVVADRDAVSGRGLLIIATLARKWGVDDVPPGKQVWADVEIPNGVLATAVLDWCHEPLPAR
jgi:anti-sigma regulatory factor (Ser/Thr protein kinase)